MSVLKISVPITAFILLFLFDGCASTKFSTVWKDEAYQDHPEKILVFNAFPNPSSRTIFEDEFVNALKDRGVDAIASHTFMPDLIVPDKDALVVYARLGGADTVLINKPIGTSKDDVIGAGGVTYKDIYVNTQTEIYDMQKNRLIMSASASTWIREGEPYPDQIRSYVRDLVSRLSRLGLL